MDLTITSIATEFLNQRRRLAQEGRSHRDRLAAYLDEVSACLADIVRLYRETGGAAIQGRCAGLEVYTSRGLGLLNYLLDDHLRALIRDARRSPAILGSDIYYELFHHPEASLRSLARAAGELRGTANFPRASRPGLLDPPRRLVRAVRRLWHRWKQHRAAF